MNPISSLLVLFGSARTVIRYCGLFAVRMTSPIDCSSCSRQFVNCRLISSGTSTTTSTRAENFLGIRTGIPAGGCSSWAATEGQSGNRQQIAKTIIDIVFVFLMRSSLEETEWTDFPAAPKYFRNFIAVKRKSQGKVHTKNRTVSIHRICTAREQPNARGRCVLLGIIQAPGQESWLEREPKPN